ncbi:hypothetical protein FEI13_18440 [Halomonas urmiana]|uniref:Guanylate cyclase domain-containing protein n=1 Tax=Halomonas urmiana TaxID=490901 RepID=A0A5R8M6B2_9GAMM|nr:hypothetical protein [Halomonas urmiana]TLF45097.1 hypothetical protein FEI13_18440 [Halomonas urmiana]
MDKRWSIYIDIEGFGARYDQTMVALLPLNALMEGIYLVGSKKYNDDVDRLFAHQFGDGFVIVSCFEEEKLDRATSIAIALMRHVLASGGLAKASISEGGFSDIKSCYPNSVTDNEHDGVVSIGAGLMTIIPVMGTALINAVSVDKRSPSGSLLTIDSGNKDRISSSFQLNRIENNLHSINWLMGEHDLVAEILAESGLNVQSEENRVTTLQKYINENKLKPSWVRTTCFEQKVSI